MPEPQSNKLCDLKTLNGWIAKDKIPPKDCSAFHLYRLLYYSLRDPLSLSAEEIGKVYESWIKFGLNPQDSQWRSPEAERSALNYILRLTHQMEAKLTQSEEFRNQVLGQIVPEVSGWKVSRQGHPVYVGKNQTQEEVTVELSLGKIHTKFGVQKGIPDTSEWDQSDEFKRLFQGFNQFVYRPIGEGVAFTHPSFGNFRILRANPEGYVIECQFPGSEQWYQHANAEIRGIKGILSHDHSLWVPVEGPKEMKGGVTLTGYLCRLQDHRRLMATTLTGRIIQVDGDTGAALENTSSSIGLKHHPISKRLSEESPISRRGRIFFSIAMEKIKLRRSIFHDTLH